MIVVRFARRSVSGHIWGHEGEMGMHTFLNALGLDDLLADGAKSIGNTIKPMGEPVGQGLTAHAADDLGLVRGTPVGTSIIDAHAGGIGVLGGAAGMTGESADFNKRLALIGGDLILSYGGFEDCAFH